MCSGDTLKQWDAARPSIGDDSTKGDKLSDFLTDQINSGWTEFRTFVKDKEGAINIHWLKTIFRFPPVTIDTGDAGKKYFNGKIGEVIMLNRTLETGDFNAIRNALLENWGSDKD